MRMRVHRILLHAVMVLTLVGAAVTLCACGTSTTPSMPAGVSWIPGYDAPGTPVKYDKVGVIKIGPSSARNVLVLEPGTSAGAAYFAPLAEWIVAEAPSWQVWSVERRENLLENQSEINLAKQKKITATELYNYFLGYLKNPSITTHYTPVADSSVEFAKQWGMNVAVQDLHHVIQAAEHLGGKVVLGGHSLGGSVVTAYATWDFNGSAGADGLAGLVYIDGGSGPPASAQEATQALQSLQSPMASPWLSFGGIPAPYAGVFVATGSIAALLHGDEPSLGQSSGLLPPAIVPPVPASNAGQFGYALNVGTSPPDLSAAQAHLGAGLTAQPESNGLHSWDGTGALTPIDRYATMFSGYPRQNVDGSEWYFPQRLTDDTMAVGNGNANPAQQVLDVDATMGDRLPRELLIYAFGAHLGGQGVLEAASALAAQSCIPASNLTLVNEQAAYAHNDPAGAFPHNVFFDHLVTFLGKVGTSH